jgi:hypothetical protein
LPKLLLPTSIIRKGGGIMDDTTYNGWKNYDTWNVSLYLNNDESLYRKAVGFMQDNPDRDNPYIGFILGMYMTNMVTPDAVEYMSDKLDYPALNDMMRELM